MHRLRVAGPAAIAIMHWRALYLSCCAPLPSCCIRLHRCAIVRCCRHCVQCACFMWLTPILWHGAWAVGLSMEWWRGRCWGPLHVACMAVIVTVHHRQGRPRVQITPSDLPESPGGKDPKDLNLLISVFGSQSPTAPGLANQFTRVIRHSLFRHQHCINGISGTADHRAHHRRSLPLFAVCHHSCALAARRRFHLHSSSSLGA